MGTILFIAKELLGICVAFIVFGCVAYGIAKDIQFLLSD